jgi:hypothetical protein
MMLPPQEFRFLSLHDSIEETAYKAGLFHRRLI